MVAQELYEELSKSEVNFETWVNKVQKSTTWGGEIEAIFVCWLFNVNICIVTNALKGFYIVDIRNWLIQEGKNFVHKSAPTIFLYHHVFKRPTESSTQCNHFALLQPYVYTNIADGVTIFEGIKELDELEDMTNREKKRKFPDDEDQNLNKPPPFKLGKENIDKRQSVMLSYLSTLGMDQD